MHEEQRTRAHDYLRASGVGQALFAHPSSIAWLSGFALPPQVGTNPFAGGPPLLWYDDGMWTLIVQDSQAADATRSGCDVVSYESYRVERPIASAALLIEALAGVVGNSLSTTGIGLEYDHLPATLLRVLESALPVGATPQAIDGALVPLRMVKTAEELVVLRRNFALTAIGHAAARQAVVPGAREIDVWTAAHSAIQRAAGRRVALGNDCVSGRRQANIGGWPKDIVLQQGDSCIVDLSAILDGYWSDSCGTYYAGEPSKQQVAMHRAVAEALQYAISLVRPGAVSGEIDRQVRAFLQRAGYAAYPHHTGHGIGVSGHEEPRIVPYNDIVLQEGMVLLFEPGIYYPGETAVRLEDAVLVTATGAEILTQHDTSLPEKF